MFKLAVILGASALLALMSPTLCRKRIVPLVANGSMRGIAKRPWKLPWKDNEFPIYAGNSLVFSLWGGPFNGPIFIYPFGDGERYLCIYNDDTAIMVFVVDIAKQSDKSRLEPKWRWPADDWTRQSLAKRATNVMIQTKGIVRFPNTLELREVSQYLNSASRTQFRTVCFPSWDLGIFRLYWSKEQLINSLSPDRDQIWPLKNGP
jgi:hypothetical protein